MIENNENIHLQMNTLFYFILSCSFFNVTFSETACEGGAILHFKIYFR